MKFYSIWFNFTEKETFQLSRDKATGHNMGYVAVIKYNLHCKTRMITLYITCVDMLFGAHDWSIKPLASFIPTSRISVTYTLI